VGLPRRLPGRVEKLDPAILRAPVQAHYPPMNVPALLSANEIRLAYGHHNILDGVTLSVAPGEKVGLVGRNGCGKTSLLKILAGVSEPDAGELSRRRGLRSGYLPQEFGLDGGKTVLENIESGAADVVGWLSRYESHDASESESGDLLDRIEAADGWNLHSRIKAHADALATPPLDSVVAPLSGGEKRRVALCRALAGRPDLLLLDEPTNHLDAISIGWLEDFLRGFPGAVIFVTHDRYFLDVIATRIIELSAGKAYSHPGNYTRYLESKALRQQIAGQAERRRQRFLRTELEWVRAGVKARGTKAKHRLDAFYEVQGLEAPPEEREMDLLIPPASGMGNIGVELVDVGARAGSDGAGRWLFRGLKLSLRAGQCTGVVGRNGAGKTTLLRLCLGERAPEEGRVDIGKKVAFNHIDQERMKLAGTGTVMEEVADSGEMVGFGDQRMTARAYLRRFLFSDEQAGGRVDRLSGGERARLMLAKVLKTGGNVIVLDEPTNDLDLPSLRMLEEALADFAGSVLVVSHDRYFLDRICDQIVAFEEDGIFVQPGNYSYYLEKRTERLALARGASAAPVSRTQADRGGGPKQRQRKLTFKERSELAGMEESILRAEGAVTGLHAQLDDPAFYAARSAEIPALLRELEQLRAKVAGLYARWEELERIETGQ